MKFNPFKSKKKEVPVKEISGTDECIFIIAAKGDSLVISVDWDDQLPPAEVGRLLGFIATGEAFNPLLQEVDKYIENDLGIESEEDSLEYKKEVRQAIAGRIAFVREKIEEEEEEEDEAPLVEPVNAIRRQLTMFQQPQG